jgi:hypothetical protein
MKTLHRILPHALVDRMSDYRERLFDLARHADDARADDPPSDVRVCRDIDPERSGALEVDRG